MYIHLTLLPRVATGELKTKPTQHSVRELRAIGIQPDVVIARADEPIDDDLREKIALFCDVKADNVISEPDAWSIYGVPLMLEEAGLGKIVFEELGLAGGPGPKDGPLNGHAVHGHRARPYRPWHRRCELDRIRRVHAASGDRPAPRAARRRRQRRDDAARELPVRARAGLARRASVRATDRPRASPAPLRVQQRVPRAPAEPRHAIHRLVAGRPARRDRRDPGSPVLSGHAVPPRVQVAAQPAASALFRFHRRRAGVRAGEWARPGDGTPTAGA